MLNVSVVIALLNAAREDDGTIREAYETILLGEEGKARRMPSDDEFERALRMRDLYAFKWGLRLPTPFVNSWQAKDPQNFSGVFFTNASTIFLAGHHAFIASSLGSKRSDSSGE